MANYSERPSKLKNNKKVKLHHTLARVIFDIRAG